LISLAQGTFDSLNRYVLVIFSGFIVLSLIGQNEKFDKFYTISSISLLSLFITLFANKYWVG